MFAVNLRSGSEGSLSVSSYPGSSQRVASMLVCSYFQRPRRVFHRVFAVNLRALGGLSQCMPLTHDPSTASLSVCS